MIKLRKLRAALAVASSGAVAAAAKELGLSQPAVTRAVQSLELELGTPLFHRASRTLACTEAGERLTARVGRAQEHLRLAEVELAGPRSERLVNQLTVQAADHELAAFVGVATEGTVSAAARACGLSQPALNRSLRALENRLGVPLFHRTSTGMRLTSAGQTLLRRTKLALAEIRQALEEVQSLRGIKGGQIRIGALPLSRARLVPLAVERLRLTYDTADIAILDGTYESLVTALCLGDVDVLVGTIRRPAPVEGLISEELFEDDIAVVSAATHPLAARASVGLEDCVGWEWVLPFKNVPLRVQFEKMLDDSGLSRPKRVIESDSTVTVRTLLLSGERLAILSRHQVHHEVGWGILKVLPVRVEGVLRPVGLTLRSDYTPTPLAQALLDELRAVAAQIRAERPPCGKARNPLRRETPGKAMSRTGQSPGQ